MLGCKHYRRGSRLRAPCCDGAFFTCHSCHDEKTDHTLDRCAFFFAMPLARTCIGLTWQLRARQVRRPPDAVHALRLRAAHTKVLFCRGM